MLTPLQKLALSCFQGDAYHYPGELDYFEDTGELVPITEQFEALERLGLIKKGTGSLSLCFTLTPLGLQTQQDL